MTKKIVIVGGGPSAKHAADMLGNAKDMSVTVIQANTFVEWPIPMPLVLAGLGSHDKALSPNPKSFQSQKADYKYSAATGVNAQEKLVKMSDGSEVPYDALVVATGFNMPLIYPGLGVSLEQRRDEVKKVEEAVRAAESVIVSGGGVVGVELVGLFRKAYPKKKITLLSRDAVLKQFPHKTQDKVLQQFKKNNIDVVVGSASNAPSDVMLEPGTINVEEKIMSYDVFIPAFSRGPNTGFLAGVPDLLDDKGYIKVNQYLQSEVFPEIFAIGVANVDEHFVALVKLNGQWNDVVANVKAFATGSKLKVHKENMPNIKVPPMILVGDWGMFDFSQLPPPVKCCCCCGLGGFPFCPPPCCWPLCGPCLCGYCCGPPEGHGPPKFAAYTGFKTADFHFKGFGEASAPSQQSM